MLNTVPRIAVRQFVLAAPGLLSSGTQTPAIAPAPGLPPRIAAAEVTSTAAWTFSDNTTVGFPVLANIAKQLPGSFVKDAIFSAGTYVVCFYLDG